jgi:Ca2+-binding RTX toxin-like protein
LNLISTTLPLWSSVTTTLPTDIYDLTLTGTDNINGFGNTLSNTITGNEANNLLSGKSGDDTLVGGGSDRLVGGLGADTLTGGAGADRFIRKYSDTGVDTITDFNVASDRFIVSASGFGGELFSGAVITQSQFAVKGEAALDESTRFIYDSTTGGLFFDADGTGTSQIIQVAQLSSGLAMTNANIFVFA